MADTATEARAELDAKIGDTAWRDRYFAGGADERNLFKELTSKIASGSDDVAMALAGKLPDSPTSEQRIMAGTAEWLKDKGLTDQQIRDELSGREPTAQEVDEARRWKKQAMSSQEFQRQYLASEPAALEKMVQANSVIARAEQAQALKEAKPA